MKCLYCLLTFSILCAACTRQETIGEKYLGAPYTLDPLGEATAPDTDPLIRFDTFDCTTFVETVLANGDVNKLNKIRYKNGEIGFVNRNHFIASEWLPNNSDLVENVSAKYGKTKIRVAKINRAAWLKNVHHISAPSPIKTVELEYIPYSELGNIRSEKPLIVLFMLDKSKYWINKTGTDLAVHHMGFLLPDGTLRHASSSGGGVVDVKFDEYVAKRKKKPNNIGVLLLEIKDNE